MRLDKLDVKGFGRIKGISVPLTGGMNVIYGGNEAGKTTLQWFIKGMLYGLRSGRQTSGGQLPPLKRFEPWDGGQYGGVLSYTLDDGCSCRVERDFRTGSVRILDGSFNNITADFSIGRDKMPMFAEKQLGMDEMTFERTAMIKQMETRLDESSSAALAAKLANVSSSGIEEISFNKAEKALADALKSGIGTDRTRIQPLDRLEARLGQLETEHSRLKRVKDSRISARADWARAKKLRAGLEAKERYLKHIGSLIEIRRELDASLKKEAGLKEIARNLRELEEKLADSGNDKYPVEETPVMGRGLKAAAYSIVSAAGVFAALLIYTVLTSSPEPDMTEAARPYIYGIGLLVTGIAGVIMLMKCRRNKRRGEMINTGAVQIPGTAEATAGTTGRYVTGIRDAALSAAILAGKPLNDSQAVCMSLKETAVRLEELSGGLEKGIAAAAEIGPKGEKGAGAGFYNTDELDMMICDTEIVTLETDWKAEADRVEKQLMEAALKEKYCEGLLMDDAGNTDELQRVEEETVAVREKIAYLIHKGNALKLAREVLLEAEAEIRQTFAPDIDRRMSRIISGLTQGRYSDLRGGEKLSLNVVVPESGDVKGILSLSGAAADGMYMALRLAMAGLLTAGGENLPLIMDEVFSQFDDNRTLLALKYLHNTYKNKQVILFTCKRREIELAQEIYGDGMNFVELGYELGVQT